MLKSVFGGIQGDRNYFIGFLLLLFVFFLELNLSVLFLKNFNGLPTYYGEYSNRFAVGSCCCCYRDA